MILHDRITVTTKGEPTGEDGLGVSVYGPDIVSAPIPAEIEPVSSDESINASSDLTITTFRLTLRGSVRIDTDSVITWRGNQYAVQGDVQPFIVNGRIHHLETLIRRYGG